jgi:hypothetical protein
MDSLSFPKSNIFVYQKHSPDLPLFLPNKGNECLAYVQYIVDHYNSLPDYVIFVHGRAMKHCDNIVDYLNGSLIYATKEDLERNTPRDLVFLSGLYRNVSNSVTNIAFHEFEKYYKKWFGKETPKHGYTFWCCGQFFVSKMLILLRPLEFWRDLLNELLFEENGIYICAYLEFVWHQLFGKNEDTIPFSNAYINGREAPVCNWVRLDTL